MRTRTKGDKGKEAMSSSETPQTGHRVLTVIPDRAGVGFKTQHAEAILNTQPELGWLEVHPENYMVPGGPRHVLLEAVRDHYPLSLHGVALSLGGAERLDREHLVALRVLIDRYEPGLISEHLAWSVQDGVYFADLLPLPLNAETLDQLCGNIDEAQDFLGRRILIENPSSYMNLPDSEIPEAEFFVTAARRTGCGLLVDVNNIQVSARNIGLDADAYVDALPADLIGEIHVAGHAEDEAGEGLLIDSHGNEVATDVWSLLERLIERCGPKPVLVEWDTDIPSWPVLHGEVQKAQGTLSRLDRPEEAAA
jgi:uncharacterized protein (UPF0276 family)